MLLQSRAWPAESTEALLVAILEIDKKAGNAPRAPCAQSRIKVRVVCARAYHALFMYNMLIRPTPQELASFGKPDFTIFNAGAFPVNRYTSYMSSSTSIDLNLRCALALLVHQGVVALYVGPCLRCFTDQQLT